MDASVRQPIDVLGSDHTLKESHRLDKAPPVIVPGTCLFQDVIDPFDRVGFIVRNLALNRGDYRPTKPAGDIHLLRCRLRRKTCLVHESLGIGGSTRVDQPRLTALPTQAFEKCRNRSFLTRRKSSTLDGLHALGGYEE